MRVLFLAGVVAVVFAGPVNADAVIDVSEIGTYTQIYGLSIPNDGRFDANPVPYSTDQSGTSIPSGISRIGYYLELDDGTGRQWVWVSMNAYTQDLTKIGVPTFASGAVWQILVTNMNVESNVGGIVTGTGINTGNIEFWPTDYWMGPAASGIGGSSAVYDFDDRNLGVRNYGSMQVHNWGAAQTLLAYNDWGGRLVLPFDDVGIGNNTVVTSFDGRVNPDWTYRSNTSTFTLKDLEVWVQPTGAEYPIPEPSSLLLVGLGVVAIAWTTRRRR